MVNKDVYIYIYIRGATVALNGYRYSLLLPFTEVLLKHVIVNINGEIKAALYHRNAWRAFFSPLGRNLKNISNILTYLF